MATLSGFRSHGIREPLTNRIAGILDEYPDGTQIARELLQNSDDARSKRQWYLLDHRDRRQANDLRLFHGDLIEYMGPALLAGNDTKFEDKDFVSMKNLAASEKKTDQTKIGQMGIGFNSIYHMTDCPSFISGDQFMIIEPHERIFNGDRSDFSEGAVKGSFVDGRVGQRVFPDQLNTFAVFGDIDFSKPYPGTIFRFPLRTESQARDSRLSKNAYPADKVLDMLKKLMEEALKGILFLKHIERIEIYELKDGDVAPTRLFMIEIVNAEEVRRAREGLVNRLATHLASTNNNAVLEYSITPTFQSILENKEPVKETWHVATMVGNMPTVYECMQQKTDGDFRSQRLIPWVGIAAPAEPGKKIDSSRLFCFLPVGIQLPFPVHVNGHFAVKQSRREIWTNQENDFASNSTANIKSVWNVHLFERHIPEVYAMFLATLGLARGESYDLWPLSSIRKVGLDFIWKDLLLNTVRVVCKNDLQVFFCSKDGAEPRLVSYNASWIAPRDLETYRHLVRALQTLVDVVTGLPAGILDKLPGVAKTLKLANRILSPGSVRNLLRKRKNEWSDVSSRTKIEMLKYSIYDEKVADLEGLPLLPLAGNQWVEFSASEASNRYIVPPQVFKVLKAHPYSGDGLVDINIDTGLVNKFKAIPAFNNYWSSMEVPVIASRIKCVLQRLCYHDVSKPLPVDNIKQPEELTDDWIANFWEMIHYLDPESRERLLLGLEGFHLLPITQGRLAPLSTKHQVVYLRTKDSSEPTLRGFINVLDGPLECRVLRSDSYITDALAKGYVFEVTKAVKVLDVIGRVKKDQWDSLNHPHRQATCNYMARWLPPGHTLNNHCLRTLRLMPIYKLYKDSTFVSLQQHESKESELKWGVASGFARADNPWLPTSVELLEDNQPMIKHLTDMIKIPSIKEFEYWRLIMSKLYLHPEDEWDEMVEKFCSMYRIHSKGFDFKSVMEDFKFVRTEGPTQSEQSSEPGERRSPSTVINPSLSQYYMSYESVFPASIYSRSVFDMLSDMGMRSTFDASFVLSRVESLTTSGPKALEVEITHHKEGGKNGSGRKERTDALNALYARMNADFSHEFLHEISKDMAEALRSKAWILAQPPSEDNPRLYSAKKCRPKSDAALVGDQMPLSLFDFNNKYLIRCMGWNEYPPLNKVLDHFLTMIEWFKGRKADNRIPEKNAFEFFEVLSHLAEVHRDPSNFELIRKALKGKPWILVDGTLHTADRVTLKLSCQTLASHFVQVPTSDPKLKKLFQGLGVRATVGQSDLESIIVKMKERYDGEGGKLSKDDMELVVTILKEIADPDTKFKPSHKLLIPTVDNILCKIDDVVFKHSKVPTNGHGSYNKDRAVEALDVKDPDDEDIPYNFAHSSIDKDLAARLQIPMLSTRSWQDQQEPWAQQEDILDRIKHILNDYDPPTIFTEFLQNAVDAGATKCCFMLDWNSYPADKVLSPRMAAWQGPALIIYNDAEFTENDFKALTKLGSGNKRDNPSKIGCYGLGFNSVYHFTDVPSVVSGSHIVFFDPRHKYLPRIRTRNGEWTSQGGQRCDFTKLKVEHVADQFAPYQGLFDFDMKKPFPGTIIRIPIRASGSQTPGSQEGAFGRNWSPDGIKSMFRSWTESAQCALLFLKTMEKVELKAVSRDNLLMRYTATRKLGSEWPQLDSELGDQGLNDPSSWTRIVNISTEEIVRNSQNSEPTPVKQSMRWLVHTEEGFPSETLREIRDLALKYHFNAHRGVAIPLDYHKNNGAPFSGRRFTHLPTHVLTGLPFHIHGVFALTSNRQGLAGVPDRTDPKGKWNRFVMGEILPRTATAAFGKLLKWMFREEAQNGPKTTEIEQTIDQYFKFWPASTKTDIQNGITLFIRRFLRATYEQAVFPCYFPSEEPPVQFSKGKEVIFTGSHLKNAPGGLERTIRDRLRTMRVQVCDCSNQIQGRIKSDWESKEEAPPPLTYRDINPDLIRKIIRQHPTFITDSTTSDDEKRWILEFTLMAVLKAEDLAAMKEPLKGLALIPMISGGWEEIWPERGSHSICYIADAKMRDLITRDDIFVNTTLFKTTKAQKPGESPASHLEDILNQLVQAPEYCIKKMSSRKLAETICEENPDGLPSALRSKVWNFLHRLEDPQSFGEVPILMTLDGSIRPLKYATQGLEISVNDTLHRQGVNILATLLKDLGIIAFDASQNDSHPYLTRNIRKADRPGVLTAIVERCGDPWTKDRPLRWEEAKVLREMIRRSESKEIEPIVKNLGGLPIWQSYAPAFGTSGDLALICARGSYFVEGNLQFNWSLLGRGADIIQDPDCNHFQAMGAKVLSVVDAMKTRLLPQFQSASSNFTGATRDAYLDVLKELIQLAKSPELASAKDAQRLLKNDAVILTRHGNFRSSRELFNVEDELCTTIFEDEPSLFPEQQTWSIIWRHLNLFLFRDSKEQIVQDCANHIMANIAKDGDHHSDATRKKAMALVKFLYLNEDLTNWMDLKWKIVPAEVSRKVPHNEHNPKVPAYMSFGELVDLSRHDVVWTQCAFFPETLKPSERFRKRFPTVGLPRVDKIVDHLKVLVSTLAPKWTSIELQLELKSALYKVYRSLNAAVPQDRVGVSQLLGKLKKPYILKSIQANPSDPDSWLWPNQLILDSDEDMDHIIKVPRELLEMRQFLEAAGVPRVRAVHGTIAVSAGRRMGDLDARLLRSFLIQDQSAGFMDVVFKLADGQQIYAHKIALYCVNENFLRLFGNGRRYHEQHMCSTAVDLSSQETTYAAFYDVLYYMYADRMNPDDESQDRVTHLIEMLKLSERYNMNRLKELITHEIFVTKKVNHSNVFKFRMAALRYDSTAILEHCEEYLRLNADSIRTHLNLELKKHQDTLDELEYEDEDEKDKYRRAIEKVRSQLQVMDEFS